MSQASLLAQWLRIRLPMQGTRVRALVRENPTCCGATKPERHTTEPTCLESMLHKRSHRNEKHVHHNKEWPPFNAARESLSTAKKTQHSQK